MSFHSIRLSSSFSLFALLAFAVAFFAAQPVASAQSLPKVTGVTASTTTPSYTNAQWFKVNWDEYTGDADGFLIVARLGSRGKFVTVYSVAAGNTEGAFALVKSYFPVGARIQFQVYAVQGASASDITASSPASDTVDVVIPASTFGAPTELTATPMDHGVIRIEWKDNSTTEEYFAIEMKTSEDGAYTHLGNALFNSVEVNITNFETPGVERYFRVRAWRGTQPAVGAAASDNGTDYSNVAMAITRNLFQNEELNWLGLPEDTPWLEPLEKTATWQEDFLLVVKTTSPETRTSLTVEDLPPGLSFDPDTGELSGRPTEIGVFPIIFSADFDDAESIDGTLYLTVLPPSITSRKFEPATVDEPFSFAFVTTSPDARDDSSISGELPPGLTYDPATLNLSGTPTTPGVYKFVFNVLFTGIPNALTQNFTIRVRPPNDSAPEAKLALPNAAIALGGAVEIDLANYFEDPDTGAAVRLETASGDLDLLLYPDSTPQTVANFLRYVDARDYDGTVFHRSIEDFVLQGGGYYPVATPNRFFEVSTRPSPINEPGVSNLRGTVAMAKIGGQPNSATTNFFFNLEDNSTNLDNQNEGFTVFGRTSLSSLPVMDDLAAKPTYSLAVAIGSGSNQTITDWPLSETVSPVAMDQSKLLKIETARRISPLNFDIVEISSPETLSATLDGTVLRLFGLAPGASDLEISITDLDGHSIAETLNVTVAGGVAQFLAGQEATLIADIPDSPGTSWQWEKNGKALKGAASYELNFASIRLQDAGTYVLAGTSSEGVVTRSTPLAVGVLDFPSTPQSVKAGKNITLTAKFAGPGFGIRWSKDGLPLTDLNGKIKGSTTAKLQITAFDASDSGIYRCELIPPLPENPSLETLGLAAARKVTAVSELPSARAVYAPATPVRNPISFQLTWDESEGTRPTSISVSGLPPGMTYDPATGIISGTPTRSGSYTIKITSRNESGTKIFILPLTISELPTASRGAFHAVIPRDADLNNNLGGMLTISIVPGTAAYSGSVRLGTQTNSFRGMMDITSSGSGNFTVNIPRKNATPLLLSGSVVNSTLNATLTVGSENWNLTGFRQIAPTTSQVQRLHTKITLPEDDLDSDLLPEGDGFFAIDLQATGVARLAGVLPDGTTVTSTLPYLYGGRLAFQQNLRTGGSLLGAATISFLGLPSRSSLSGNINWSRNDSKTTFSPQSFEPHDFPWTGRRYVTPDFNTYLPMDLVSGQDQVDLALFGSEVDESNPAPEITLIWNGKNRFAVPQNPHAFKISLNLKTGIFSGTFQVTNDDVSRRGQFRGLWIPLTGGRGFFLLPQLDNSKVQASGAVELNPGPTPTPTPTPTPEPTPDE